MRTRVPSDAAGPALRASAHLLRVTAVAVVSAFGLAACAGDDPRAADAPVVTQRDAGDRTATSAGGPAPPAPEAVVGVDDVEVGVPTRVERQERPPAGRAEAERDIATSLGRLLDPTLTWEQRRTWVEGEPVVLDLLGPAVQSVATSPCAAGAVPTVRSVFFLDPSVAEVTFTVDGPSVPEIGRGFLFGTQLVAGPDGRWRSRAADVRAFVETVAPHCSR